MSNWKEYRASATVTDPGRTPFPTTLFLTARSDHEARTKAKKVAERDYTGASVEIHNVIRLRD